MLHWEKDIVKQLKRVNSDLSKSHSFDFYLYFPTQYEANEATIELIMEGLTCEMRPGAMNDDWLCLVSIQLVPEVTELARLENIFVTIATAHNGEYDGWESMIIP